MHTYNHHHMIYTDRSITMSMQNQSKIRKILDTSNLLLSGSSPMMMMTTMMNPMLSDRSTMFMDPIIMDRTSMFKSSTSSESSSDSLQTLDKLLSTKVSRRGRYKCSRCGELKVQHPTACVITDYFSYYHHSYYHYYRVVIIFIIIVIIIIFTINDHHHHRHHCTGRQITSVLWLRIRSRVRWEYKLDSRKTSVVMTKKVLF